MPTQALPGFRDFFPDEAAFRNHIFAVWRDVAHRYGFEEYEGPPLEALELYTQKSGDEIVQQLYSFEDKGGRAIALRPEATPTLARMVAQRARALKKPIRWFTLPQLFRYERQQRGRLREHFQLNMDILGEPGPLADAEVIAAAVDIVRTFGLTATDFRVRVSDRRVAHALLAARGLTETQIPVAYAHIDKLEREPRNELLQNLMRAAELTERAANDALEIGDLRTLDQVREAVQARGARGVDGGETVAPLIECLEALEAMGLGDYLDVDLSVVRGLDYYTGIVFELFDAKRSLRAICGGGRYDGLLQALGGIDMPAVGFGMGDVVLGELIAARIDHPPAGILDAFVVAVTSEDVPFVLDLAHRLRDHGKRVEFALKPQSVGKQLKLAAARSAKRAILVGPDEREAGVVVARHLESGEEERMTPEHLLSAED
ncbi:MAG: histidine--tRNA ligase [Gemmatimonadales bacterium]|jgi:histidyl-tRNA synthetase